MHSVTTEYFTQVMLSRRLLRIKALRALYSHFKSESDSLAVSEKNLLFSIDKTYELYHQMLWLVIEVAGYAENRIELGRRKHLPTPEERNPNTKFIDNRVIARIRTSENLTKYIETRHLGWVQHPEAIKNLYNSMVESDYYKEYMSSKESSFREDLKLVEDFYLNEVDDNDDLEAILESQSIMWAADMDFSLVMVMRTLSEMREQQETLRLLPEYKNNDDREFVRDLFRNSIIHHDEYFEYIDRFTKNWDVERIAFMDNLIMSAAMAEFLNLPTIPIKVTLDEYIELAKYYSTPGSSTFINGILDKIVGELRNEGRINKTGRGLL